MLASSLYITKMVLTTYFHCKRMEQERIGTRALFFKFSGLWIILFYFIFWSDYYGMQFIWIGVHLRGVYSFSSAVDFIFSSSFTFIWHVHYWQLCSWLSMVGGAVFVFCLRGEKKEKSKRPVKKRSSDPISFGVSHFFLFFTVCSLLVKKMEGGKRGICIQQKAPDCSLFCWNVLRPLDLLVGDPGIQSNCNLDWRERACTVYW